MLGLRYVVATRDVKIEGKIQAISEIETLENPHDFGKEELDGLHDRKDRYSNMKKKQYRKQTNDKEVHAYLGKGW